MQFWDFFFGSEDILLFLAKKDKNQMEVFKAKDSFFLTNVY